MPLQLQLKGYFSKFLINFRIQKPFLVASLESDSAADALQANLKILETLTKNVCGGVSFQYSYTIMYKIYVDFFTFQLNFPSQQMKWD